MRARVLALTFVGIIAPEARLTAQQLAGERPALAVPAPVRLQLGDLFNAMVARVGDDVFIGGQPSEAGLRQMRAQGVTTVVNLRIPEEMRSVPYDEAALATQLGMKYVLLPSGGRDYPFSPETVQKFADAMRSANGKVLLHCQVGWRASHLWAAYLIEARGVSVDSALANARAINLGGHMRGAPNAVLPVEAFLGRRLPELASPPSP